MRSTPTMGGTIRWLLLLVAVMALCLCVVACTETSQGTLAGGSVTDAATGTDGSAAIQGGESYGYQIIKDIKPYLEISESTLYPILRRLEENRMLSVRSAEHNGRLRKYYSITGLGKERLADFVEEWKEIMAIYRFVTRGDDNE